MQTSVQEIRPNIKRNGISLTLLGSTLLVVGLVMFLAGGLFAQGLVCFTFGGVITILGYAKVSLPAVSLSLTPEGVHYYHKRGQVFIEWDNIQRVDIPRVTQGLETIDLQFVALKLKQINPILDNISLRLATGLMTEQRPLLMTAAAQDEMLETLEHYLSAEFTPLVVNGDRYRGVLAMFGHRCEMLNKHLGYHIYIPIECLDRSPEEFVALLRQTKLQLMVPEVTANH